MQGAGATVRDVSRSSRQQLMSPGHGRPACRGLTREEPLPEHEGAALHALRPPRLVRHAEGGTRKHQGGTKRVLQGRCSRSTLLSRHMLRLASIWSGVEKQRSGAWGTGRWLPRTRLNNLPRDGGQLRPQKLR